MKKVVILVSVFCVTIAANAAQLKSYLDYIAQWKEVALQHQTEFGIPAAITLAQGLLESGAGSSELAREANNHFGIKCTADWTGETYRHDDETANECFRSYSNAADSYRDHAIFLKRARYETLFSLSLSDYKAWAVGLKNCGYATDTKYPDKLIKIIEDYELYALTDTAPADTAPADTALAEAAVLPAVAAQPAAPQPAPQPATQPAAPQPTQPKPVVVSRPEPIATITANPEEEQVDPISAYKERRLFMLTHPKQKVNGRTYVIAQEGDSYSNIAFRLNRKERRLRIQNDALGRTLQKGDYVFLGNKATQGPKEKTLLWVHPGESLWMVAQREGVQEKYIRQYNGFDKKVKVFKTRQAILLRKKKDNN